MKIVIEVPHQKTADVTLYSDESAILDAVQMSNEYFIYEPTHLAAVRDQMGMDEEDFSAWMKKYHPELIGLADTTPLVELAYNAHNRDYVLASQAPTEYAWALDALGHDLHELRVCDSYREALAIYRHGTHHQGTRILAKLESRRFHRKVASERLYGRK